MIYKRIFVGFAVVAVGFDVFEIFPFFLHFVPALFEMYS